MIYTTVCWVPLRKTHLYRKRRDTLFVIELNKCCKIRYKIENLIKAKN